MKTRQAFSLFKIDGTGDEGYWDEGYWENNLKSN